MKRNHKRLLSVLGVFVAATAAFACINKSSSADVLVTEGIPYCTGKVGSTDEVLRLDIARPKSQTQALPAILLVHGGGWAGGSREDYRYMIEAIAQQGMIGISVDYRLSPQSTFPAQLEDLKCAVRWMRESASLYQFDTRRIVAMGGSAGAHLVALLGSTTGRKEFEGVGGHSNESSHIDAMVLHAGPYDLGRVVREALANPTRDSGAGVNAVQMLLGGNNDTNSAAYKIASPTTYITPRTVPAMLIHGRKDTLVPYSEAESFHALLRSNGVPSKLFIIDDAGHGDFGETPGHVVQELIAFFKTGTQ